MEPAEGDCEIERCTKGDERLTAVERIGGNRRKKKTL